MFTIPCRPHYYFAWLAVFIASVVWAVAVTPTSLVLYLLGWVPYFLFVAFVETTRRERGRGALHCSCPRHLKPVPVKSDEDEGYHPDF